MPWPANTLADLESRHALADGDDITDYLVARDARVHVAEVALLHGRVGVTHATGEHLDEDLALTRRLQVEVLE